MNKPQPKNYSVEGLDAAGKQFYRKQGDLLAAQFGQLNTKSGVVKPVIPAKPPKYVKHEKPAASLTEQFGELGVKGNHPPERRDGPYENRTGFDEMSDNVPVPASSGNEPGFDRTVFDRTFDGSVFDGTDVGSLFFYGLGQHVTNDDGMETDSASAPAPAPAPASDAMFDPFERPIHKQPNGGKKRKSKRMKTRYRKKYKGKRSNKTRRYRK